MPHHLAPGVKDQWAWPYSFALRDERLYDLGMKISGFDHIVLCVGDVDISLEFYQRVLGMTVLEERRANGRFTSVPKKSACRTSGLRPL